MKEFDTKEIEAILGYTFNNKSLLKQAFTRRSYVSENSFELDNEVLEFIGDSVVGMLVTKRLTERYTELFYKPEEYCIQNDTDEPKSDFTTYFCNNYLTSRLSEAELSEIKISLVRKSSLAKATETYGLEQYLRMGKGDYLLNVHNEASVKEDLFESIIGAITVDCEWNIPTVEHVVDKILDIDGRIENKVEGEPEYQKLVSKWLEEKGYDAKIFSNYDPNKRFPYSFYIDIGTDFLGHNIIEENGKTKSGALRLTAKRAWEYIENITKRAERIIEVVGKPDINKAVNQLQILWQKKIIKEPIYNYSQEEISESGNPKWSCSCYVENIIEEIGGLHFNTKTEAKKYTAYETMLRLCNVNHPLFDIKNYTEIKSNSEKETRQ